MSDDEHMARVRSLNERLRATEPGYQHGYKDGCIDTVKRCVVSNAAERAVIKAAEAWTREHYPEQYDALHQAVEALQEVE